MARKTLFSLAAGAALLSSSSSVALVRAASLGSGLCVALDATNAADNNVFADNSPEVCAEYCSSGEYTVLAVYGQACFCWSAASAPAFQQYANIDNQDCYQSCAAPYAAEFCGGADKDTFQALYNYFVLNGSASAAPPSAAATTAATSLAVGASSPPSSGGDPAATAADPNPSAAASGSPPPSTLVPVVSSASAPAATPAPGSAGWWCPPPSSSFQSTSFVTATFTCSNGDVETTVLAAGATAVCYDPAVSTTTAVEDPDTTSTAVVLVPVVAMATPTAETALAAPPPMSAPWPGYNNDTSTSAQAAVASATTLPFQGAAGAIVGRGSSEWRTLWALVGMVTGFLVLA